MSPHDRIDVLETQIHQLTADNDHLQAEIARLNLKLATALGPVPTQPITIGA